MIRFLVMLALALPFAIFAAPTTTGIPIKMVPSRTHVGETSGDPQGPQGARVVVRALRSGDSGFGSSHGRVMGASPSGAVATVEADILVSGSGKATLWLKAMNGPSLLSFASSSYMPVEARDGQSHRRLSMNVPRVATGVYFGFTYNGDGEAVASGLRVYRDEELADGLKFDGRSNILAVVDAIKQDAMFADRVEWSSMAPLIEQASASAESYENYKLYEKLLAALKDGHSSFRRPEDVRLAWDRTRASAAWEVREVGQFGYVKVPPVTGRAQSEGDGASMKVAQQICAISPRADGWMVDLRGNTGGNMWSMLAALSPLLGSGELGYFVGADGSRRPWKLKDPMRCNGELSPVAILIDAQTASAGEMTAIAFLGRDNVRTFGETSAGRTTSISSRRLPDGAALQLVTAFTENRGGVRYGNLVPDVETNSSDAFRAAEQWLSGRARP